VALKGTPDRKNFRASRPDLEEAPASTPGERDWSLPGWDPVEEVTSPGERDVPATVAPPDRPSTGGKGTRPKFQLGKAPATDDPEFLSWLSGVVYRVDAESEIRHQFYRDERKAMEDLQAKVDATANAIHSDVQTLKEVVGQEERPHPVIPGRRYPATGLVATMAAVEAKLAAVQEEIGEEPDPVRDRPGQGIKGRLAVILEDRRFYRVLIATASGIVVLLQAVRVIYGLAAGHP
jgi:hypothetical protein